MVLQGNHGLAANTMECNQEGPTGFPPNSNHALAAVIILWLQYNRRLQQKILCLPDEQPRRIKWKGAKKRSYGQQVRCGVGANGNVVKEEGAPVATTRFCAISTLVRN